MTEITPQAIRDDQIKVLSEAIFRAGLSNPDGERADIAWAERAPREGYRAAIVLQQLSDLGWQMVPTDVLADIDEAVRTMKADYYLTELVEHWRNPQQAENDESRP